MNSVSDNANSRKCLFQARWLWNQWQRANAANADALINRARRDAGEVSYTKGDAVGEALD
ncbi:hypothetical protein MAR_028718 [Mya arenaria]|uniref:Uncharacterized protein n=1 Tax=Mya arenaria TaxID=6604 RepID=A0ABY7DIX1_MYAAR|nr:hypothetical protein MAR_028718 [Mya arenaria]